jgi:hypothetical protein
VLVRTIKTSGRGYSGSKERSTSYPTGVGKSIFATATATTTDKGKASKSTENHSETSILDKSNGQVMVAMEVLVTHEDKKTGGMTGRYKMAEVV